MFFILYGGYDIMSMVHTEHYNAQEVCLSKYAKCLEENSDSEGKNALKPYNNHGIQEHVLQNAKHF